MLATTTKPYNPNKKDSLDTDWDKIDLCSFLRNINIINIDENDISYTGKDYSNATNREIVAEIIRTINATHYNSLLGMKDIINYNNNILKITESSNKSIAICNKKIKYFEAKINRINFLLTKAAHTLPAGSLLDYQTMEKAQNILKYTSCNDLTFTEDDFKYNNNINNISKPTLEPNINNINDTTNNITISTVTNNKIESYKVESVDIKDHNIKSMQKPPKQLQLQLIQPLVVNIPLNEYDNNTKKQNVQNIGAISRGKINEKNEPQIISSTNKQSTTMLSPTKPYLTDIKTDITFKPNESLKKQSNVHSQIKISAHFKGNKMKKNKKNGKKNYKNNRKNKNKNKKIKVKKKTKLQKKKNTLSMDQINEMIQHYEFTDDQYQDWMNLRMSQRSGLSAYDYYEEYCGPITEENIKEWSSVHYSN